MTLYVIACGQKHNGGRVPAMDAYLGRGYDVVRREIMDRVVCGDSFVFLSAEHGVVGAFEPIESDYDRKMTDARMMALASDSRQQAKFLDVLEGHEEVKVFGGSLYRALVRSMVPDGVEVDALVGDGRGCGDHFSALHYELAGQWEEVNGAGE